MCSVFLLRTYCVTAGVNLLADQRNFCDDEVLKFSILFVFLLPVVGLGEGVYLVLVPTSVVRVVLRWMRTCRLSVPYLYGTYVLYLVGLL